MNLNNELEYRLAELIFYSAEKEYFILSWKSMNETIGLRLKKALEANLITKKDLNILRNVIDKINNKDNSNEQSYADEVYRITDSICLNEIDYVIDERTKTSEEFNFLDEFEEELINIYEEILGLINDLYFNANINVQIRDNLDLLISIYNSKDKVLTLNEKEFCKEFNLIYYNDEECWETLRKWLIEMGCPEKHLGTFRLRLNAIYAMDVMLNHPEFDIEDMLENRGLL